MEGLCGNTHGLNGSFECGGPRIYLSLKLKSLSSSPKEKAGSYFVHCCFFEFVFQDFDSAPVSLHLKVKKLPLSALTRRENYQSYIQVAKGIGSQ